MIDSVLLDRIKEYCKLNEIEDLDSFINDITKVGFNTKMYGPTPFGGGKPEIKEVEVIKEVIKEVIVEKEVDVIKEVEVIVEKEVFVTDDEANKELQKKLTETTQLIQEMTLDFDAERNVSTQMIDELNASVITLNRNISDLEGQIKQLEGELIEAKANKKPTIRDIYGEGSIGSNLM
jgi:hypothetical protein